MTEMESVAGAADLEVEQLRCALRSRERIGIAKGMLMIRYSLTDEQAFAYLIRRSQDGNIKIRDLAEVLIAELSVKGSPHPSD